MMGKGLQASFSRLSTCLVFPSMSLSYVSSPQSLPSLSSLCLSPARDKGKRYRKETGEKEGKEIKERERERERGERWGEGEEKQGREGSEGSSSSLSCSSAYLQFVNNYFAASSFFLKETEFAAKSNTPSYV